MDDEKERKVERKIDKNKKPLLNGQVVFKSDDTVVCIHRTFIIIVSSAYKACICVGNRRRPVIYTPAKLKLKDIFHNRILKNNCVFVFFTDLCMRQSLM